LKGLSQLSVWIGLAFRQIKEENEGQINPTKLQIGKHGFFFLINADVSISFCLS
jgi:hypothetical protein